MAVPDFQSLFIPVLKFVSDGNEHSLSDTIEALAQQLGLCEADRDEMLPSGKQRKFDNRVSWARTYLQKAQLLAHTGRSNVCITEQGLKVLRDNPTYINTKFLKQFPEFLAFHTATGNKDNIIDENIRTTQEMIEKTSQTPQDILETSYQRKRFKSNIESITALPSDPVVAFTFEKRPGATQAVTRSIKVKWADRFYTLRNHIIHGDEVPILEFLFERQRHTDIATMFFVLLTKMLLNDKLGETLFYDKIIWGRFIDRSGVEREGFVFENGLLERIRATLFTS